MLIGALLPVVACSGGGDATPDPTRPTTSTSAVPTTRSQSTSTAAAPSSTANETTSPPTAVPADAELNDAVRAAVAAGGDGCDPLDTRHCYLPFPSDAATVADHTTATGLRVALPDTGAPRNSSGVPIDVAEWNRNDGFSPSSTILTSIPDLDAEESNLPSWTDIEGSLDADTPVVIVDLETGERVPLWAELEQRIDAPGDGLLVIHPAISLPEGHRFAVALRGLSTTGGEEVRAGPVFRSYRDRLRTDIRSVDDRRIEMERMFAGLAEAGIQRENLVLAWTFTVASTDSITRRVVHARDATLAELGDRAPAFAVTTVTDAPEPGIGRLVEGTFTVPNWLIGDGTAGNRFQYSVDTARDPDALPVVNGTVEAPFACMIPAAVLDGGRPARLVQYGHGLLGSHLEIDAGNIVDMGNEHRAIYCATKWAGMSEDDVGNAVASLQDMSNFPTMSDRMQQGMINQIVLGRLMLAAGGLAATPAFTRPDGSPLADADPGLVYDGNSQGAIMGLALAALSPDIDRAALGVIGINYSILLPRSVDFDDYDTIFRPAYPDPVDRLLIISMIQMLWDRGEGAGYVQHVTTDPLKDEPTDVLLHVAFGDWQVSELSAYIAARTMGVPVHRPITRRSREVDPGWGLPSLDVERDRSALVIWDSGSDPIPIEDVPPRTSRDPHGDPRSDIDVRRQKAAFLFDGELIDICNGQACRAEAG